MKNPLMTSFRKRLALVMIFFSMAPIFLFGIYAYDDLSDQRKEAYEHSYYYAFSNDLQKLVLWLESRKLNAISDGKLHFLSDKAQENTGIRNGRYYEIIREGSKAYEQLEVLLEKQNQQNHTEGRQSLTKVINFNTSERIADDRTLIYFYFKDQELSTGKNYYIKEEVHLRELIGAVEKALDDQFVSYTIFVNERTLFSQNKQTALDPYNAYYNRDAFTTVSSGDQEFMGIYEGNDIMNIHVAAYRDYTSAVKQIQKYQTEFFIKVMIAGLIGIFTSLFLARKINYPIQKLKQAVEDILNGHIESRILVEQQDEFGQIYESFNHLAEIETSNYKKMIDSGEVIGEKNKQLIELNGELQMAYEHLSEAMTQLEVSKSKQEALINNIGELIWTMDAEGIITFVNQSVLEKLGYEASEFIEQPIQQFVSELENGDSVELLMDQMQYVDLENISVYFSKKGTDEKAFMLMNTKRIFEDMTLKSIQGFARTITDDWMIHHMTLRRNKEMEIAGQISWVLANNILLDELSNEIVKKIEQLLHPDLCLIGLITEGKAEIANIGGSYAPQIGSIRLTVESERFIAQLESQKLIRSSVFQDYFSVSNEAVYEAIQEYVLLPLKFDHKIIGFFGIASSRTFSDSDLKVLKIIANQSAVAIDKAQLYKKLKEEYLNTIRVLATAVEAKDAYTEGHSYRVSKFAKLIAEKLAHSEEFVEEIEISGILHDIGKIGIFDEILTKRGMLSEEEYQAIQQHPAIGFKITAPIKLSQPIIDGILLHHKRYDLKGYPVDICIEELPLAAGIIGVADAIDAMSSTRSYSDAKPLAVAMREIEKHRGGQFHPEAADAVLAIYREDSEKLLQIINEEI